MKRIFAYILCVALSVSLCVPAFAFEEDGDDEKSELLRAVDIPESLVIFISEEVGHMDDAYEYFSGREPDGKGATWGGGWPTLWGKDDIVLEDMACNSIFELASYVGEHITPEKETRWKRWWIFYSYSGGKAKTLIHVSENVDAEGNGDGDYHMSQMGGDAAPLVETVSMLRAANGDDIKIIAGYVGTVAIDITDPENQTVVVNEGSEYDGQVIPIDKYLGWWQRNAEKYRAEYAVWQEEHERELKAYREANNIPDDEEVILFGGQGMPYTPVPFAPMTPLYQKTPPGAELLVLAGSLLLLALSALLRRRRS